MRIATETLRSLHRLAARLSDEADDLVQDALLAALEQPRTWDDDRFLAWASGVIRRRALFIARTAGRRRRRDASYAVEASAPNAKLPAPFIDGLAPSLQTIALLANAGLGRREIAHLLAISDTALRKRISDLRRAWQASGAEVELAPAWPVRAPCGVLRRSLRSAVRRLPEARFAVVDPDGHEIFLGVAHKPPTRGN